MKVTQSSPSHTGGIDVGSGRDSLIPITELVGFDVIDTTQSAAGKLIDVVVRWDGDRAYPIVLGFVIDIDEDRARFLASSKVVELNLDTRSLVVRPTLPGEWQRRNGELRLIKDFIGRQIVDLDGIEVFRAKDLFLARIFDSLRLVAVCGKKKHNIFANLSGRDAKAKLVDWAAVQPFGDKNSELRLALPHDGLKKLRPGELADILENLDRAARNELTEQIDIETVADAVEEMEEDEVGELLIDTEPARAAQILARMEPDEAVDALRDLGRADADEILAAMPPESSQPLARLLEYPEAMVGGFMTTFVITTPAQATVDEVRTLLRSKLKRATEIDAVAVVDDAGTIIGDLSLFQLFTAETGDIVRNLLDEHPPITVGPDAFVRDAVDALIQSRRSSVVVVDNAKRPIGRVLADDMVDALLRDSGFHFRLPWVR